MSKCDRRLLRKHNKFKINFTKRNYIRISDIPTQHLLVNNGGLGNNVQREQLLSVFEPYGQVTNLVMEQDQPYAFVSYSNIIEASAAHTAIHGCLIKALQTVPSTQAVQLYLSYVDKVPDVVVLSGDLPEGLVLIRDFVNDEEEQVFLQCVDWDSQDSQLSEGAQLTLKHRRVKHYGYEFMYGINNVDPERPLEQAIPSECDQFLDRLVSLGCLKQHPDQLTVNQYKPGQGIPIHMDTHSAFEDGIVVLSLGTQAIMDFRGPMGEHFPVLLPQRSLAIMLGPSRYQYTHGIMPRKSDVVPVQTGSGDTMTQTLTLSRRDIRTSFTFRILRRGPCHCCYPEQCDSQRPVGCQENPPSDSNTEVHSQTDVEAAKLEAEHVHKVYEEIAGHFSNTRHTPWPRVVEFLKHLPPGALVADVGCGNGKYLSVNPNMYMVGLDRSGHLVSICGQRGLEACVSDVLTLPLRSDICDAAVCIAVIHHFSTEDRRQKAVQELVRVLQLGGRALIYVWAFEQERNKHKSNYLKGSKLKTRQPTSPGQTYHSDSKDTDVRKPHNRSCDQVEPGNGNELRCDNESESNCVIVRCEAASNTAAVAETSHGVSSSKTDHGFTELTTETESPAATGSVTSMEVVVSTRPPDTTPHTETEHRDHTKTKARMSSTMPLPVHVNRTHFQSQDLLVPWHLRQDGGKKLKGEDESKVKVEEEVYHRYYHVFVEKELEELCHTLPNTRLVDSYYDKGNWCVVIEKTERASS